MELCKATLSGVRVFTATQGCMHVKCVGFVHGVLGKRIKGKKEKRKQNRVWTNDREIRTETMM